MRFWLGKGVDGFRVDVIWHLIKDAEFRDNPPNPNYREGRPPHEKILTQYSTDQPEVHEVIAEMRRVIDEFDSPRPDRRDLSAAAASGRLLRQRSRRRADAVQLRAIVDAVERAFDREDHRRLRERRCRAGAWPNWVLGNHDRPRVASRVGPEQARVAAMLLLTLRGTPTLYYGDEIGMHQVAIAPGRGARSVREERAGHRGRPRRLPHADAMGRDALRRVLDARARGCRWPMILPMRMSPISTRTPARSSASTRR